jgi:phosphosulfolactate synthase (CoM biosynthesis protein A)
MWGDYIDGFKFAGGSQRLLTIDILKRIIDICHNHDVYVSTGGFIERVIVQGFEAVDKYLEECKSCSSCMNRILKSYLPNLEFLIWK